MSDAKSEPKGALAEPQSKALKCLHVKVHGRVQGVFFRSRMKDECDGLGVKGWVKNLPDGTVEAMLQGKPGDLDSILEWCRKGPERADVSRVESHEVTFQNVRRNFEIVY
jgi:acylphosphatase